MIIQNEKRIIHRLYMNNALDNYSYFFVCPESREALLIDPTHGRVCIDLAKKENYKIKFILNTHDHWDHIGGNEEVVQATGAEILCHKNSMLAIQRADRGLQDGDQISLGKNINFKVLETPGHTEHHICLLSLEDDPVLVCGDTLFNAGCGNIRGGGNMNKLYLTFKNIISNLPENTKILPGHDYIENNLGFAISREPNNSFAKEMLSECATATPDTRMVTNLEIEKRINVFLRLDTEAIFKQLQKDYPSIKDDSFEIFKHLRQLRDQW